MEMLQTNTTITYTSNDEKPRCECCDNYKNIETGNCKEFCGESNRFCYYMRTIQKVEN